MILELVVATIMSCNEAQDLIDNVNKTRVEHKQELIEVIKSNSESQCFSGGELNEGSKLSG